MATETRSCRECGFSFELDDKEQDWWKARRMELPVRCPKCRKVRRELRNSLPGACCPEFAGLAQLGIVREGRGEQGPAFELTVNVGEQERVLGLVRYCPFCGKCKTPTVSGGGADVGPTRSVPGVPGGDERKRRDAGAADRR